jgi:hypothetical protein
MKMGRLATMLVAVVLLSWSALVDADTGFLDRVWMVKGEAIRYQVYVPVEWTATRTWPVMLHLHGNGSQGTDGLRHTSSATASIVNAIRQDRRRFPVIIVFPQAATRRRDEGVQRGSGENVPGGVLDGRAGRDADWRPMAKSVCGAGGGGGEALASESDQLPGTDR